MLCNGGAGGKGKSEAESRKQKAERRKAESRKQKAESRRRKAESGRRRRKAEGGRRNAAPHFCFLLSAFCFLLSAFLLFCFPPEKQKGSQLGEPLRASMIRRLCDCVRVFVRSDSRRHLIFQMKFPLLQRLLFELFLSSDLVLRDQLVEAIFTPVMFFDPLPELGVFLSENSLNVSGTIRHRFPSFEGHFAATKILALSLPPDSAAVTVE
jgi:hypothetical protein